MIRSIFIFFIILILISYSCSPKMRFKRGEYNLDSEGNKCLPCKRGYVLIGDTCYKEKF